MRNVGASSQKTHIFASFIAFIKLEVRRLNEHISWYEQKAIIGRYKLSRCNSHIGNFINFSNLCEYGDGVFQIVS